MNRRDIFRFDAGIDGRARKVGDQGYLASMHSHDELELDLCTRGRAALVFADRRYEMKPGTLSWVFPAQEHVIFDQSADYEMWVAILRPEMVSRICTTAHLKVLCEENPPGTWCRRLRPDGFEWLGTLLGSIVASRDDPPRYNAGLAYLLLCAWDVFHAAEADPQPEIHPAVDHAARLIRNETDDMKLSVLAKKVGLSESRLGFLFRAQMGVSLVAYRQQQQLKRFLRLYAEGDHHTMLDAVLEAGFGSYAQFHRVFKQNMGYGPAAFRRKVVRGQH